GHEAGNLPALPRPSRRGHDAPMSEPAIRLAEPGFVVLDTTIGDVVRDAAARAPDVVALVHGVADPSARRRWTFAQLYEWACGTASVLAHDVASRDRLPLSRPAAPANTARAYA